MMAPLRVRSTVLSSCLARPKSVILGTKSAICKPFSPPEEKGLQIADFVPKITDFGLAKQLDKTVDRTRSGAIMGTPSYMAPEQAMGKASALGPAADTYAPGA